MVITTQEKSNLSTQLAKVPQESRINSRLSFTNAHIPATSITTCLRILCSISRLALTRFPRRPPTRRLQQLQLRKTSLRAHHPARTFSIAATHHTANASRTLPVSPMRTAISTTVVLRLTVPSSRTSTQIISANVTKAISSNITNNNHNNTNIILIITVIVPRRIGGNMLLKISKSATHSNWFENVPENVPNIYVKSKSSKKQGT